MRQRGFSYIEVLVATLLIAITLVPAIDALKPGIEASALHRQRAEQNFALLGKMEAVLAESFASLDSAATAAGAYTTATSYSDISPGGITRNVYVWRYDVDNADSDADFFTGGEDDLLWVRVALADGSYALHTLVSSF